MNRPDHHVVAEDGAQADMHFADQSTYQLRIRDPRMIPSGRQVRMVVVCWLRFDDPAGAIARVRRLIDDGHAYQVKAGRA